MKQKPPQFGVNLRQERVFCGHKGNHVFKA